MGFDLDAEDVTSLPSRGKKEPPQHSQCPLRGKEIQCYHVALNIPSVARLLFRHYCLFSYTYIAYDLGGIKPVEVGAG